MSTLEDENIHRLTTFQESHRYLAQEVETKSTRQYILEEKDRIKKSLGFCHRQSLHGSIRSGRSSTVISVNRDKLPRCLGEKIRCNKIGGTCKKRIHGTQEIQQKKKRREAYCRPLTTLPTFLMRLALLPTPGESLR